MWTAIIGKLLGTFSEKAADIYIEKKRLKNAVELERLRGKIAWQEALTRRASESEGRDHEWELESIRNSGWKDEWVLILLSVPLVLVFIPPMQPYVLAGFEVLAQTPEWYRWLVMLIFTAIYGIRIWRREVKPPVNLG